MWWERRLFDRLLENGVKIGALAVSYPDGVNASYGETDKAPVRIRIASRKWMRKILLDPELALGEAYMDKGLEVEDDDIFGLLDLIWINFLSGGAGRSGVAARIRRLSRRLRQFNPADRARRNAEHHYDIGNDLYRLFLDEDLQYSCAYFARPGAALEEAQREKKKLIAKKLVLAPTMSVLEIGGGWGGLAMTLAEDWGADVTSITLSTEQARVAKMRASARGLGDSVRFEIADYRSVEGRFDRIVSVGMFEHVGAPHFEEYFSKVASLLEGDGVALIHMIGRTRGPGATNGWIAKHIFPGGYIPALSEIAPAIERAGLFVTDLEVWRLHYAKTLCEWRRRFNQYADRLGARYDGRFRRMWHFYLAASELSFTHGEHVVFQFQLSKKQTAAPLTRDYLYEHQKPIPDMCATALHSVRH